jgi:ABC-2 type transport system permease protein
MNGHAHAEPAAHTATGRRPIDPRALTLGFAAFLGGGALLWAAVHWAATLGGVAALLLGFAVLYRQLFPAAYTITKKEIGSYFNSPVAYIVVTVFLALVGGLFFFLRLFLYNEASVRGLFEMAPWAFIAFGPAISMRLLAEERKTGTIELLVTMPVTDWEIVIGKFLGALFLLMVGVALTGFFSMTVALLGQVDPGPVAGGYLGLLLLGATFTAIGLLASSWTSNQIIAFILSLTICLVLWLLDDLRGFMPTGAASVVEYLSVASHHRNLARGVVDLRDILYYASAIGLCLYLSKEALASRRWR